MVRALASIALAACGRVGFDAQLAADASPFDGAPDAPPPPGLLAVGGKTACLLTAGEVWCWGNGEMGRLGDGGDMNSAVPVQPALAMQATAIFAGDGGLCALTGDAGAAYCWGPNSLGQLGLGNQIPALTPQPSSDLDAARTIAFATNTTCAIRADGIIVCAGDGARLGILDPPAIRTTFAPIGDRQIFTSLAGGDSHVCALTLAGRVRCWGLNTFGALGNGTIAAVNEDVPVDGPPGPYVQLVAGDDFTCGLTPGATVECWGRNLDLQLGTGGGNRGTAAPVVGLTDVASLAAGSFGACALRTDRTVWCWGDGDLGSLGDGSLTDRATPQPAAIDDVALIASATDASFCALRYDGSTWCWGRNDYGQLGIGSIDGAVHALPERVRGLP